jgi:hypothetical protein
MDEHLFSHCACICTNLQATSNSRQNELPGLSLKSKKYEASSCVSCRDFIEGLVYKKIGWVLLVVDKITVLANHRNLALVFFVLVD